MTNLISRPKSAGNVVDVGCSRHHRSDGLVFVDEGDGIQCVWKPKPACPAIERRRNQYIDVQGMLASILVLAFKVPLEIADFKWLTSQLDNFPNNRL